jgi:hypothetical protein
MKILKIMLLLFTLLVSYSYAAGLSDFPKMFVNEGDLNAIIVVGNKAPSTDALAQSRMVVYFGSILGKPLYGVAKLSSDVGNINQNIISIGNPCDNPVTLEIMGNPDSCDSLLKERNGLLKLYQGDYSHLIVSGSSSEEINQALKLLIESSSGLSGNEAYIEIESTVKNEGPRSTIAKDLNEEADGKKDEQITVKESIENEDKLQIISKDELIKSREEIIEIEDNKPQINHESENEENKDIKIGNENNDAFEEKEENIIEKFFSFILAIFRQ